MGVGRQSRASFTDELARSCSFVVDNITARVLYLTIVHDALRQNFVVL